MLNVDKAIIKEIRIKDEILKLVFKPSYHNFYKAELDYWNIYLFPKGTYFEKPKRIPIEEHFCKRDIYRVTANNCGPNTYGALARGQKWFTGENALSDIISELAPKPIQIWKCNNTI